MTHKDLLAICRKYLGPHYRYTKVKAQIQEYADELELSYDQIASIVKYWYEIKLSDPARSGGGIGILPHIYKEALDYWEKQQEKSRIMSNIQDYAPPQIEVVQAPKPRVLKPKKTKLFELK